MQFLLWKDFKEEYNMITFTILAVALLTVAIVTVLSLIAGGAGFILAFGDLIIAGLILYAIFRLIRRRK